MSFAKIIVVIFGLFLYLEPVFAIHHDKVYGEGRWDLESSLQYLKSTSNFTDSGTIRDLPSGNYFQLIDISAGLRYGFSPDLSFYFYGNIGNATSSGIDADRSNSTLNKIWFGGDYLINMGSFELMPEGSALFALEKISETQDAVMNNEGVNEFTGKLNVRFRLAKILMYGYGGFTYRSGTRSNLFPWGLNAEIEGDSLSFGGEIFGFQSITDDSDKGNSAEYARDNLRNVVNAGSDKFYSLNPSVIDTNVYMKIRLQNNMMLWGAAGMSLNGRNYANAYHAEGGLRFSFGDLTSRRRRTYSPPAPRSQISTDKKIERFEEDTNDGVDQRIFRPEPTPAPKLKAKPRSRPPEPDLQEKMDDVEMQIELRSNKKRKNRR